MTANSFNVTDFRLAFPPFRDIAKYPDAILNSFAGMAFDLSDGNGYPTLGLATGNRIIQLLTAHYLTLNDQISIGDGTGIVTSSRVGDVSVSMQAPPGKSQFQYWLNLTPYGQQLYSLLQIKTAGGFYFAGRSFKSVGGFLG